MVHYRKIGGVRFLSIGRIRVTLCVIRPTPMESAPHMAAAKAVSGFLLRGTAIVLACVVAANLIGD